MRSSKKLIKILAIVCSIILIQSYSNAEVIKFSNCKHIKDPTGELAHKVVNTILKAQGGETTIYNEKEALKKLNDPFEFINRTFDTETKILTYESKKKGEDLYVNKSNFKIRDEKTFTIVSMFEGKSGPFFNEETKKLDFKGTAVKYTLHIYDLSDATKKTYSYNGSEKELLSFQKCKSDYSVPGSSESGDIASGTAFFINNRGNLLTNNHVVEGCEVSKINYFNKEYDTELIATDKILDLALLKAEVKPKSFISFSKKEPKKRQNITVAGYPLGKYLSDDLKINDGKISALKGFDNNSNEIQHDIPINPGNSGGPIVNENGELVAVAVSGMAKDITEGLNFGIKSSAVENFLTSNQININVGEMKFSMSVDKVNKLLEESTVYIFCN